MRNWKFLLVALLLLGSLYLFAGYSSFNVPATVLYPVKTVEYNCVVTYGDGFGYKWFVGDFDGDGKRDLLIIARDNDHSQTLMWHVCLASGKHLYYEEGLPRNSGYCGFPVSGYLDGNDVHLYYGCESRSSSSITTTVDISDIQFYPSFSIKSHDRVTNCTTNIYSDGQSGTQCSPVYMSRDFWVYHMLYVDYSATSSTSREWLKTSTGVSVQTREFQAKGSTVYANDYRLYLPANGDYALATDQLSSSSRPVDVYSVDLKTRYTNTGVYASTGYMRTFFSSRVFLGHPDEYIYSYAPLIVYGGFLFDLNSGTAMRLGSRPYLYGPFYQGLTGYTIMKTQDGNYVIVDDNYVPVTPYLDFPSDGKVIDGNLWVITSWDPVTVTVYKALPVAVSMSGDVNGVISLDENVKSATLELNVHSFRTSPVSYHLYLYLDGVYFSDLNEGYNEVNIPYPGDHVITVYALPSNISPPEDINTYGGVIYGFATASIHVRDKPYNLAAYVAHCEGNRYYLAVFASDTEGIASYHWTVTDGIHTYTFNGPTGVIETNVPEVNITLTVVDQEGDSMSETFVLPLKEVKKPVYASSIAPSHPKLVPVVPTSSSSFLSVIPVGYRVAFAGLLLVLSILLLFI